MQGDRMAWLVTAIALIVAVAVGSLVAHSADAVLDGPVPAELVEVIDGDTYTMRVTVWLGQTIDVDVRLRGVDTPETHAPKCKAERERGRRATEFARTALGNAHQILLTEIGRDKYGGRVVAAVMLADARGRETRLGALMIEAGLARAYDGGAKTSWCR